MTSDRTQEDPTGGRRLLPILLILCLLLPGLAPAWGETPWSRTPWNQLVVFGDSFSDTRTRQYNDGLFWVEYLRDLSVTQPTDLRVYARAGARSNWDTSPTGTRRQVYNYVNEVGGNANPEALYTIYSGTNDYVRYLSSGGTAFQNHWLVWQTLDHIEASIKMLMDAGAKNIVVVNLPDLSRFPFARGNWRYNNMQIMLRQHNEELARIVGRLDAESDVNFLLGDAWATINYMIDHPHQFGITNVFFACGSCSNPEEYIFWDNIHPTSVVNLVLAHVIWRQIPEPVAAETTAWMLY